MTTKDKRLTSLIYKIKNKVKDIAPSKYVDDFCLTDFEDCMNLFFVNWNWEIEKAEHQTDNIANVYVKYLILRISLIDKYGLILSTRELILIREEIRSLENSMREVKND